MGLNNNYIGMRNVKTGIAVVMSIIIARAFHRSEAFFVATAALLTMQSTVRKGVKVGKDRVLGTIVGAIIGVIMTMIDPGNLILIFIGIVVLISILNVLQWQEAISIACVVFCSITFNLEGKDTITYAVSRIIDTTIGILISLTINHTIVPPKDSPFHKYMKNISLRNNRLRNNRLKKSSK